MTARKRKLSDLKNQRTSIEHEAQQPDQDVRNDEASTQGILSKRRSFFEQLGNEISSVNIESSSDGHVYAETVDTVDDPFAFESEHGEPTPSLINDNENITGTCLILYVS